MFPYCVDYILDLLRNLSHFSDPLPYSLWTSFLVLMIKFIPRTLLSAYPYIYELVTISQFSSSEPLINYFINLVFISFRGLPEFESVANADIAFTSRYGF